MSRKSYSQPVNIFSKKFSLFSEIYGLILTMKMNEEQQAKILLNNEIKVTDHRSGFVGMTGLVRKVMADDRTLEIELANTSGTIVMMDVSLVSEVQEPTQFAKTTQDLGPIANHLVKDSI
tara:strand:+ start:171 stop:530 length:360 start_codon:yes stop_codon:yes gene_type:complete